jgi:hypothetical protein
MDIIRNIIIFLIMAWLFMGFVLPAIMTGLLIISESIQAGKYFHVLTGVGIILLFVGTFIYFGL